MRRRSALSGWIGWCVFLALATASCTKNVQYRTDLTPCDARANVRACAENAIEETDAYMLGFVEFDDQGWFWDRQQMWTLLDRLSEAGTKRDLLMVVFVHGWKHNAQVCDTNVACLRETLIRLDNLERASASMEGREPRRIVGVYVGWRGLSLTAPVLKETTFYSRKATAQRVGARGVTELLLRLDSLRTFLRQRQGSDTRLVYVGHSFGGALLYSAVSQLLIERSVDPEGTGAPPHTLGDLVVLVNPAFEAALYHPLWEIATNRTYFSDQRPVIAILTSEGDDATGVAFPLGRSLSTIFQQDRDREQGRANRIAVGHYQPYFTHRLESDGPPPGDGPYGSADACQCPYLPPDLTREGMMEYLRNVEVPWTPGPDAPKPPPGWELHFPGSVLRHLADSGYDPLIPFMVVEVDNQIIEGHNQIYRPVFVDFLRFFISLTVTHPGAEGVTVSEPAQAGGR